MNIYSKHIGKYLTVLLLTFACNTRPVDVLTQQDVALAWAGMTLDITKNTPANSPTYASRCLGYIGLVMYESIVNGFPENASLAGQLNGLSSLPKPESNLKYDWILSLNSGQATILKYIYNQTSDLNKLRIDSLEKRIFLQFSSTIKDKDLIERSVNFGKSIADTIFEWSKTDGGHRGYLKNFDKARNYPNRPGLWKPPLYAQSFSHFPLHPDWGENRTFVPLNSSMPLPYIIPYDTSSSSKYYHQFELVFQKEKVLTQEEKEIAIWWSDDPEKSFTPPGHSYYITLLALKKLNPDLITCAEAFARTGIAVADAFINCWKWKYYFFSERPNTFIPAFIDQEWESFWPDPPFPAFPSGHAIQAAAAATVQADLLGDQIGFIDSTHVGRQRDELRNVDFRPRSFSSFWDLAEETANSRFYGGIHTPQDNMTGLQQGKLIAANVNKLNWKREKN